MKLLIRPVFTLIFLLFSCTSFAAKTYITLAEVSIFDRPDGKEVAKWPSRTIFTSNDEDSLWIRVSGAFPEGVWQPQRPALYVKQSHAVKERETKYANAPSAVIYTTLKSRNSKAKAYRLMQPATFYTDPDLADTETQAQLPAGYTFTSGYQNEHFIKITGHFPQDKWQPLSEPLWLKKPLRLQDRTPPNSYFREPGAKRFAVIDKVNFDVTVYEVNNGVQTKIVKAPVALGYDRCLSKAKGGKCYYTPEGQYEIEFKLFDADGINWCIPKKMEAEFKDKIARGERCWRGIMGNHAMHFGNSLFLHGTSNPKSIGSRSTHGCVRLRNSDISILYRLLDKGDKVLISEQPEDFDLLAIAAQMQTNTEVKPTTSKHPKISLLPEDSSI